jgi:hypothetical protein
MRGDHLQGMLASSGTSTGTLIIVVIGEALIIGLLIVLLVMLRRNRDRAKAGGRDPDAAYVSGSLEIPLVAPRPVGTADAASAAAVAMPPTPPGPPPGAIEEPAAFAPPPAVSWDMSKETEEEILDPENMPIPAYTGPKLAQKSSVDFDLGIPDDFGGPSTEAAAEATAAAEDVTVRADDAPSGSKRRLRRSRRAGQAPPPPFT